MRRMRAEQIRYHFGRNFLPLRGMCCFNLIRYGTYQGDESTPGIGDVLPDTRAPLCPPPPSIATLPLVITGCDLSPHQEKRVIVLQ